MSTLDPNKYPASGGGWISGSMSAAVPDPVPEARDTRPEYSPASVVLDVRAAMQRAGVQTDVSPNQLFTASIAAADLLRALGVRPTTVPLR